jgi:hypothetical protein
MLLFFYGMEHGRLAASIDYIFLERLQFSGGVGCEWVGSRMTTEKSINEIQL